MLLFFRLQWSLVILSLIHILSYIILKIYSRNLIYSILDHFETKDSQGNYFNNIAGADMTGHTQTDVYISNGKPAEYRPHFTYHGFRYVRVICDAPVKPEDFTAVAHAGQFWARDKEEKNI